jgi:predicted CoA-binding protein
MNSIKNFLAAQTYAVAGASARTHKYGYKVFKALLASNRET